MLFLNWVARLYCFCLKVLKSRAADILSKFLFKPPHSKTPCIWGSGVRQLHSLKKNVVHAIIIPIYLRINFCWSARHKKCLLCVIQHNLKTKTMHLKKKQRRWKKRVSIEQCIWKLLCHFFFFNLIPECDLMRYSSASFMFIFRNLML